jgi:outer membrane murein-binding lipoprotein Lpp
MKHFVRLNWIIGLVFILAAIGAASMLGGCAEIEKITGPITGENPLAVESADTIGYGIGMLAAKDDALRSKVEIYYAHIQAGGLTAAAVQGVLDALGEEKDEYKFLAYKLSRLITRLGGKFIDGKLVDLGPIDPVLLDAAKQGYLMALTIGKKA